VTQGTFAATPGGVGNFETVVLEGTQLMHYWHDNSDPALPWRRGAVISSNATGPGCLIQSTIKRPGTSLGNLEVVVPEGNRLVHYWHDSADPAGAWQRDPLDVSTQATGGGCIIQSDFSSVAGGWGNLEVVVLEGRNLVHYWHDSADLASAWHQALAISTNATGPGCLIQSTFKDAGATHGNLEAVVPEGDTLWHYWHNSAQPDAAWQRDPNPISQQASGAGCLIQSTIKRTGGAVGNFEAVVKEGSSLVHYWHDSAAPASAWQRDAHLISQNAAGPGCILQSTFSTQIGGWGNLEAVALEQNNFNPAAPTLVHYWHDSAQLDSDWHRGRDIAYTGRSQKVCQLTGALDREYQSAAPNAATQYGVEQTDLGFPVSQDPTAPLQHQYLLFGDTGPRWEGEDEIAPNDSVGYTDDAQVQVGKCPHLSFVAQNGSFVSPTVLPAIPQGGFNVPESGFVANNQLYAFFWTGHTALSDPPQQGRSVLASTDPLPPEQSFQYSGQSFHQVYEFSQLNFIYTAVAIDQQPNVPSATLPGPPSGAPGIFVWGVNWYRGDSPRLAYTALTSVRNKAEWWYWKGSDPVTGQPTWAHGDESQAARLFDNDFNPNLALASEPNQPGFDPQHPGCVGELSVTYNSYLGQWLMLYNCGDQVRFRTAAAPWGPWSDPQMLFNPTSDGGYCHFMYANLQAASPPALSGGSVGCSQLDAAIEKDKDGNDESGGVYAPFVINRFTTGVQGVSTTIYYTLSTWNPYQVVLMTATLVPATASPAAVSWGPNRIDVVARGADNAFYHRAWDDTRWQGWERLGGAFLYAPAISSSHTGQLDVFGVGTDHALWHGYCVDGTCTGGSWHLWERLGGFFTSAPAAVSWGPNRIDVVGRGGDNALWHGWWDGSAWRGYQSLGGSFTSGPAVSSWGLNRLDVFGTGADMGLWHGWWDGAAWHLWERVSG
jgi:hypothetical protein